MDTLPAELYRPTEVAELDRQTIEVHGVPGYALMTRAGTAAYTAARRQWPRVRRMAVLCGGGNNGGDGYVIARLAAEAGVSVRLFALSDPERLAGSAAEAARDCRAAGVVPEAFDAAALASVDLIVDALLGTGLDRPVTGPYATAIEAVNAAASPVLAVDIPSGLNGDTGAVMGVAVVADVTVTFIGLKRGLLTGDGPALTGELRFEGLKVPAAVHAAVPAAIHRVVPADVAAALPPRQRTAHKGHCGHVLVIGGDRGMGGAARLAAEAAARVGAGLVSVATRAEHVAAVLAARPELMVRAVDGPDDLAGLLERASVVAIGPGLGRDDWGRALFERAQAFTGPMVVDADGLNLLAEAPGRRDDRVITPHPGEAARLLGSSTADVQADRFTALDTLQAQFGGAVVLKGAGSLIGDGDRRWLCDCGNPGMASGGMGDVLTGVIAGLIAQGVRTGPAAAVGARLHGQAADAAAVGGERGLLAGDLLPRLRAVGNP